MEKNLKKNRDVHTHIKLNHFAGHLKLTQHCKLTTLQFLKIIEKEKHVKFKVSRRKEEQKKRAEIYEI